MLHHEAMVSDTAQVDRSGGPLCIFMVNGRRRDAICILCGRAIIKFVFGLEVQVLSVRYLYLKPKPQPPFSLVAKIRVQCSIRKKKASCKVFDYCIQEVLALQHVEGAAIPRQVRQCILHL